MSLYKRYSLIMILFCALPLTAQSVTSHSFFSMRPPFQSGTPELFTLLHDAWHAADSCHPGTVQVTVFGGKTTPCNDCINPLAQFLMPFGKTTLLAGEFGSEAALEGRTDISANYFGVLTADPIIGDEYALLSGTFESNVSMNPQQSMVGAGILYKQAFWVCQEHAWWFSASTPLMRVKNRLNFCETVINPGSGDIQPGSVGTITESLQGNTVFGSQQFNFGKITVNNCPLTKTGFADVELKLGYVFQNNERCFVEGYGGVVVPTGNRPCGEFIFEPIVGNNHHFGFIFGADGALELLNNDSCSSLQLAAAWDSRYLLGSCERRSFDLIDKQWSRYIWLYPNAQATAITDIMPGINTFTQPLHVEPRFSITANLELLFTGECSLAELGFNLYARQAEKVSLQHCWRPEVGIVGILPTDRFVTATKRNATQRTYAAPSNFIDIDRDIDGLNPAFIPITEQDLNLQSAAHPAYITHTVYGALGYRWCTCIPTTLGIGGSYEFSADNTGSNRWLIWGKAGVSF